MSDIKNWFKRTSHRLACVSWEKLIRWCWWYFKIIYNFFSSVFLLFSEENNFQRRVFIACNRETSNGTGTKSLLFEKCVVKREKHMREMRSRVSYFAIHVALLAVIPRIFREFSCQHRCRCRRKSWQTFIATSYHTNTRPISLKFTVFSKVGCGVAAVNVKHDEFQAPCNPLMGCYGV